MDIAGLVLTLVDLGRRIALAVKDAKDLPETIKDYINNIERHLALIKQIADQLHSSNHLFKESLKQLPEELEQLVHVCEEKYLGKRKVGQQIKHFFSGDDVQSKIIAIDSKVHSVYLHCLVVLHIGTEVHLTSFESKLDLPISTVFHAMTLTRDEVRGDVQKLINSVQRIEHHISRNERVPTRQDSDGVITAQDINVQTMSGTVEKMLFNSRFEILISALDREIPLLPFPSDFKRVYDTDEEHDVILDDALADCMSLLRQLRYRKPLDRMRHFLNLRTLVRQLIALRFWKSALNLSVKLIALLHDFRIYLPNEFLLDLIVAYATHALLLGANSQLSEAQTACERALSLTKQLGREANTHPIYPLVHRIAAYFVDDITARLTYLLEAAQYYRSILPSSLETLPCAETLSSIGRCYLKQQKPLLAIEVLEEAKEIFCGTPSTPPDDLIICFIRLGRAFQATGQLKRANEILEKAYHALECAKETSLNELLARVRQEHGIPSSVSAQSDPVILLPSIYQAEGSVANNHGFMLSSVLFNIDEDTTNPLNSSSDQERWIPNRMSLSSRFLSPEVAQEDAPVSPVGTGSTDSLSFDSPTPTPFNKDQLLPTAEDF